MNVHVLKHKKTNLLPEGSQPILDFDGENRSKRLNEIVKCYG